VSLREPVIKVAIAMQSKIDTRSLRKIARSFDHQLWLSHCISDADWQFDSVSGLISFTNQCSWHAQLLGTESATSGTWLWAWANSESGIPAHLLVASLALKAYGEHHGIPELTTPQLPLDQIDGHTLALLASGICEANAYYHCPYEGGALFVLIMDENFPKCTDPPLQRIATVFPQAIASLEIPDHRLALASYLDHYGLGHEQDGDKLVVKESGEAVLTATVDEHNRLTNLEARLKVDAPATNTESWEEGQLRRMMGW
jgi:hypothetical protein